MDTRAVTVIPAPKQVEFINKAGERLPLGDLVVDTYEGENIITHNFKPAPGNPFGKYADKSYRLGVGSKISTVNPADYLQMAIDNGWSIMDQVASFGGATLTTILRGPQSFEDIYSYDSAVWGQFRNGQHNFVNAMFPGMKIETDMRIGRMALEVTKGIFRLVCTNGLIDTNLFNAGGFSRTHAQILKVEDFSPQFAAIETEGELLALASGGSSVIGDTRHFEKAIGILRQYRAYQLGLTSGKSGGLNAAQADYLDAMLVPFIGKNVNHLPKEIIDGADGVQGLLDVYAMACEDTVIDGKVTTFDVLNATTTAINLRRQGRDANANVWRHMQVVPAAVTAVKNLTGIVSLFSDN